jgi:hypothetical protein
MDRRPPRMKNLSILNDRTQKARERHELASKMHMNAVMSVKTLREHVGAVTLEHDDAEKIHKEALESGDTIVVEIALTRVNCALEESSILNKRLREIGGQKAKIEEFEQRTGLEFNALGPLLAKCCFCGELFQYIPDHTCRAGLSVSNQPELEQDISSFDNDIPTLSRLAPTPTPTHLPMGPLPRSPGPDLSLATAGFSDDDNAPTKIASASSRKTTNPSIPTPTPIDNT